MIARFTSSCTTCHEPINVGDELELRPTRHQRCTPISFAEQKELQRQKAERRAERFQKFADSASKSANTAAETSRQLSDQMPLGQPILVGHHSENKTRKHYARVQSLEDKAYSEGERAADWRHRASVNAEKAKGDERHTPEFVARRIDETTREISRARNQCSGYKRYNELHEATPTHQNCTSRLKKLEGELTYWQELHAQKGGAAVTVDAVSVGDYVFTGRGDNPARFLVIRVNTKSVTVDPQLANMPHYRGTIRLDQIVRVEKPGKQ